MKILTSAQMGEVDRLTSEIHRIPTLLLMENAGRAVADALGASVTELDRKRTLVLCGKGNNGGDGFVVARYLALRGCRPEILLLCDPSLLKGDALTNWNIVQTLGIPIHILETGKESRAFLRKISGPDVIVDALFGTGLSKPVTGDLKSVVDWINRAGERAFVISVDIPSGLFADSAMIPGPAVRADLTVTFTALKPALVFSPAAELAGKVSVASIGSPPSMLQKPEYRLELIDPERICTAIPSRRRDSHKGTYGHVFVVAGSRTKSGAALMAGLAALRSGAGLVTLWLPNSLQKEVVGKFPELMTEFVPETPQGSMDLSAETQIQSRMRESDVLVIGPGLTTASATKALVRKLVSHSIVPVVLDADGINAFAGDIGSLRNLSGCPIVITPHPGEMARLLNSTTSKIQRRRIEVATEASLEHSLFTILKGHQTLVVSPNGQTLVNDTGNPGMATGGSGDILAGIVGCFVGKWCRRKKQTDLEGLATHLAAAVYLHGLAGDLAADRVGMESLIATDLLPLLPAAFKKVTRVL